MADLLLHTLDEEGAEFSYFLAGRLEILECRRSAVRLVFFETIPLLNDNARFRRITFYNRDLASGGKVLASGCLDHGLSLRNIGRIRCLIRDIDFRDRVDRRLGLSMKPLDGDRAR
jgi:hypothetical protein